MWFLGVGKVRFSSHTHYIYTFTPLQAESEAQCITIQLIYLCVMVIVPDFNTSKVNLFYFGAKCAWKKVKLNLFLTTFEFSKYIRLDVVIEYMHICVRVGVWGCVLAFDTLCVWLWVWRGLLTLQQHCNLQEKTRELKCVGTANWTFSETASKFDQFFQ